jgi:hypothetical protein
VARKKLDLTGALEEILQREQEAQRLFEESGRREQLFRSEEERTYDEALLEAEEPEYDWTDTSDVEEIVTEEAPPEPPAVDLPDPSEVIRIAQSTTSKRQTRRPDDAFRHGDDYYIAGSTMSTRVQGIQWIPTTYINESILDDRKGMLYGYGPGLFGDILVAFARPSKSQSHAIYVFASSTESEWELLRNADSLGRTIETLSRGRMLQDGDEARYKDLHKGTETKDAWEDWLFDYPEFRTIRAGNSRE